MDDDEARKLGNRGGTARPRDDRMARHTHAFCSVLDDDCDGSSLHGNRGVGSHHSQRGTLMVGPEQMPGQEQ